MSIESVVVDTDKANSTSYFEEYADSLDVITDGLGNVVSRRCPNCGSKSMSRVAPGVCKCLRCGV